MLHPPQRVNTIGYPDKVGYLMKTRKYQLMRKWSVPGFLCDCDKKRIGSNQSNRWCAVSLARTKKVTFPIYVFYDKNWIARFSIPRFFPWYEFPQSVSVLFSLSMANTQLDNDQSGRKPLQHIFFLWYISFKENFSKVTSWVILTIHC